MFAHAGVRPPWPVVLFAPWLILGLACLVQAVRNVPGRAARASPARRRSLLPRLFRIVGLWGVAGVALSQVALADPASQALLACRVTTPQEAGILADNFFEKGQYQQAGACYETAGDMVHANLAFLKAAGPRSEETARALKTQQQTAKTLFSGVGNAFRSDH
jgi:hypothetical protein